MVSFTSVVALLPLLSALVAATPINKARDDGYGDIDVVFTGATPDDQYSMSVPIDSNFYPTDEDLSISHISTSEGAPCVFFGVDGAVFISSADGGDGDVGPPQTIVGVICGSPQ